MLHFKFVKECFEDRGCFEYRHPVRREPHERNLWAGILRDFLYTKKFFSSTRKIKKIPSKMGTQPRSRPRIVPIFKGNFRKYEVFVGIKRRKTCIYPLAARVSKQSSLRAAGFAGRLVIPSGPERPRPSPPKPRPEHPPMPFARRRFTCYSHKNTLHLT